MLGMFGTKMWMGKKRQERCKFALKRPWLWYLARSSNRRHREHEWNASVMTGQLCAGDDTKEMRAHAEMS
jgi:hypothetical protein